MCQFFLHLRRRYSPLHVARPARSRSHCYCLAGLALNIKIFFFNSLEDYMLLLKRSSLVILLAFLAGCAGSSRMSEEGQAMLLERAEARWLALVDRDWDTAYEYTSPAYRDVITKSMYRRKFSYMVEWELTSVDFVNYDARAAVASVAIGVMSRPVKQTSAASVAIGAVPTRVVEQWILVDGEWWYSANL